MFLVKVRSGNKKPCKMFYTNLLDETLRSEKLKWFANNKLEDLDFDFILHDDKNNWINQADNDFDSLLPLVDKEVKLNKSEKALFKLFSLGVITNRDEWVYDFDKNSLENKMSFFIDIYQNILKHAEYKDKHLIKWDSELDSYTKRYIEKEFKTDNIVKSAYRPFTKLFLYFDKHLNGRTYQWFNIYKEDKNKIITFKSFGSNRDFNCL